MPNYLAHRCITFSELEFICTGVGYEESTGGHGDPRYLINFDVERELEIDFEGFFGYFYDVDAAIEGEGGVAEG